MPTNSQPTRSQRALLAVLAIAMSIAAIGDGMRFRHCTRGCCPSSPATVAVASGCCAVEDGAGGVLATAEQLPVEDRQGGCDCCGCCAQPGRGDRSPADDDDGDGRDPDCCIEVVFDLLLMPGADDGGAPDAPQPALMLAAAPHHALPTTPVRFVCALQRGPPRCDRLTALRACTVLLI